MNKQREKIYDTEVSPIVAQLIAKCKEHNMPMFQTIQFSSDDFCTTCIGEDGHMALELMSILQKCIRPENGINMDAFLLTIMKRYKNTSSAMLAALGHKPTEY